MAGRRAARRAALFMLYRWDVTGEPLAPPFDPKQVPADGWFANYDAFIPLGHFPVPGGIEKAGPGVLGVARLARGVTLATANANLEVVSRRLEAANPRAYAGRSAYDLRTFTDTKFRLSWNESMYAPSTWKWTGRSSNAGSFMSTMRK